MSDDGPVLAAALRYAARGWAVFPCSAQTKAPLVKGDVDRDGKAIPRSGGVAKASTDAAVIRAWWGKQPNALIGVAMGKRSGLFAVDFDPRTDDKTGEVFTLERLKADVEAQIGAALPKTFTAVTQSGGVHVYFALPDDGGTEIRNVGSLPPHVDVRGEGGYVIMPPSVMTSGKAYRWKYSPDSVEACQAPAGLLAALRAKGERAAMAPAAAADEGALEGAAEASRAEPARRREPGGERSVEGDVRKYVLAAFDRELEQLRGTGDGGRNNALNASAFAIGSLVATGRLSLAVARAGLLDVASLWPNIEKSTGTIDSGLGAGQANPRDLSAVIAEAEARHDRYGGNRGQSRGRAGAAGPSGRPRAAADAPASGPVDDVFPAAPCTPDGGADSEESSQMGGFDGQRPPEDSGGNPDREGAYLPLTDLGNAERWECRHGRDFRYCDELGWLAWDGRRWSKDDAERLLQESIFATVRAIGDEADWMAQAGADWRAENEADGANAEGVDPDPWVDQPTNVQKWKRRSDKHRAWGRASEAARAIGAIRTLGQTKVTARLDAFDSDVWKLNLLNGTLVIDRGRTVCAEEDIHWPRVALRPHDRRDLITMLAPVDYIERAPAPIYDAFLARVQPDAEVRRFLHAWGGYCLTGDATEQKFVINHGATGANGKSTWIDAIASLMGDYAIAVNIATFMDEKARSGSSPSPDLAELPHKRLVRTSEPPKGVPFAEALVKLVTGGEPLPARQLNKPFFRYLPEFKITVSMNPVPQLSDDAAIWRRTRVVPWNVSIPEAERDHALPVKLKAEASGILWRLVEGLIDWCAAGLPDTAAVAAATQQIRDTVDPLGRFLAAACALDGGARVNSTELFKVYEAWAAWAGEKVWSQNGFSRALANRGFEKHQSSVIYFLGLKLLKRRDDFVDPQTGQPWRQLGGDEALGDDLGG